MTDQAGRSRSNSAALLAEITDNPLDPGYALAAQRRAQGSTGQVPRPRFRTVLRVRVTTVFVVLGLLLGAGAGAGVAQLRSSPLETQSRALLESEVERRSEVADGLAADNDLLRQEIAAAESDALGAAGTSLAAAVEQLGAANGALPVGGPGVRVVLDDAAPTDLSGEVPAEGRVLDTDLRRTVNWLWAAGAEAIAVNGQRITSTTYIAEAGLAIVIDGRPLARPYEVEAVGDPDALLTEARTGELGRYSALIRDTYDVEVSVQGAESLELPGSSRLSLRYASGPDAGDSTGATVTGP